MSKEKKPKAQKGKVSPRSRPQQPPSKLRGIVTLLIGFALSLLVAEGFKTLTNENTYKTVLAVQASWYDTVDSSTPFALASSYWDDIWYVYDYGPAAVVPLGDRSLDELTGFRRYLSENYQSPQGEKELYQVILTPFLALARTFLKLTEGGGWTYLWVGLQLAMGVPAFMLAFAHLESTPTDTRYFPEHIAAKIIVIPAGIVLASSVLAFGLKYLMLGGLIALGWLSGLAEACCGAMGVAGFCWWCTHKFAEYQISGVVQPKVSD